MRAWVPTIEYQEIERAQWTFKPSPDVWSIQEWAEHVILAEDFIFDEAQKVRKTPAVTRLSNATSEGDRQVVAQKEDRSTKGKAPKVISQREVPDVGECSAGI